MEHLENIFHSGTSYSPLMTGKYFVKETCKLLENYAKKGFKIPEWKIIFFFILIKQSVTVTSTAQENSTNPNNPPTTLTGGSPYILSPSVSLTISSSMTTPQPADLTSASPSVSPSVTSTSSSSSNTVREGSDKNRFWIGPDTRSTRSFDWGNTRDWI